MSLDITDHTSWYYLANSWYIRFFTIPNNTTEDLTRALTAYKKSESLGGTINPDLCYNRGNIEKYLQHYDSALSNYSNAIQIDPALKNVILLYSIHISYL